MAKVIIYLRDHEMAALSGLAEQEYRVTRAQAALIIRKELEHLQLIPSNKAVEQADNQDRAEENA
jgi:hypothetical protein